MKKREETFLLVSMKEEKAKKLAQVITSESCRRILDRLAHGDATETAVANELAMPLSTVHYNLQQLLAANLVKVEEFHYSEKGKEVNHYSLANKFIIIAPDTKEGLSVRIRQTLPSLAVLVIGAGIIYYLSRPISFAKAVPAAEGASSVVLRANAIAPQAVQPQILGPPFWFLAGGALVFIAILITLWVFQKRQ